MTTTALVSSEDVIRQAGNGLSYAALHRWTRDGAVTPTQPATGTGSRVAWTPAQANTITAIAQVRADLRQLGLPCPWNLVAKLWNDLTQWGEAHINAGTITISVHLGPETQ